MSGACIKPRCVGCHRTPAETGDYAPDEFGDGWLSDGTFNRATGTYWCDECYIAAEQPLGKAPASCWEPQYRNPMYVSGPPDWLWLPCLIYLAGVGLFTAKTVKRFATCKLAQEWLDNYGPRLEPELLRVVEVKLP